MIFDPNPNVSVTNSSDISGHLIKIISSKIDAFTPLPAFALDTIAAGGLLNKLGQKK